MKRRRAAAMVPHACHQCGAEILDAGIEHRRRRFCSDECCEVFEDLFMLRGGPDAIDLAAVETEMPEVHLEEVDLTDPEALDADLMDDVAGADDELSLD